MACNSIRLDTKRLSQDYRVEEHSRLSNLCLLKLLGRTLKQNIGNAEAENLVCLLEESLCLRHIIVNLFAHAYGLPLLESIEEEAGSEASAREIVEVTELVREHDLPVIFTEVNGSEATARAIGRETGCAVARLSMCMDGPDGDLSNYIEALRGNAQAIVSGFGEKEAAA